MWPRKSLVRSLCGLSKTSSGVPCSTMTPLVHEDDAVGDVAGEAHLVGDDDHRHAALGELLHDVEHAAHELGVERRGDLVEEHHVRVHRQRAGDGHALLLAAGELRREVVDAVAEAHLRQAARSAIALGLGLGALQHPLLREHHVALGGEVREQVEALEHHADLLAHLVDVRLGVVDLGVLEPDLAARGLLETVDAAQQRRLARAGRAEDDDDLALVDVDVDALEHLEVAEGLAQVLDADDRLVAMGYRRLVLGARSVCSSGFRSPRATRGRQRHRLRRGFGVAGTPAPPSAIASRCSRLADPVDQRDGDDQVVDGRDHERRQVARYAPRCCSRRASARTRRPPRAAPCP